MLPPRSLLLLLYLLLLATDGGYAIRDQGSGIPGTTQTKSGYDTELGTDAMCWTTHGSLDRTSQNLIKFPNPLIENFELNEKVNLLRECPRGNTITAQPPNQLDEYTRLRTKSWYNFTVAVQLNVTSLLETAGGGFVDSSFVSDLGPQVALQVMACEVGTAGFCSPYKHEESNGRLARLGITQKLNQGDSHGGTHVHSGYQFVPLPSENGPLYNFTIQVPMIINTAGVYFPIVALQLFFKDYFGIKTRYDIANAMPPSERLLYYLEPPTILSVSHTVRYVVYGIVTAVALVMSFMLWQIIKHRDHEVLKLTQGGFLAVFLVAGLVATLATVLLESRTDWYCRTGLPIVLISSQLLYAITLGRLWRIHALISPVLLQTLRDQRGMKSLGRNKCFPAREAESPRNLRKEVGWVQLAQRIAVWVVPQIAIQLWSISFQPSLHDISMHPDGKIGREMCRVSTNGPWLTSLGYAALGVLMMTLMAQAHQTRSLPSLFNETRDIFDSTVATIVILLLGLGIASVTRGPATSPSVDYLLWTTINLSSTLNSTLRIVLPKLQMIWRGERVLVSKLMSDHKERVLKDNRLYEQKRGARRDKTSAPHRSEELADISQYLGGSRSSSGMSNWDSQFEDTDPECSPGRKTSKPVIRRVSTADSMMESTEILVQEDEAPSRRLVLKLVNMQQKLSILNNSVMSGRRVSNGDWDDLREQTRSLATIFETEVRFAWERQSAQHTANQNKLLGRCPDDGFYDSSEAADFVCDGAVSV